MEDKIKLIVKNIVEAGINMNPFLKASGWSIKEKIAEVTDIYKPIENIKYRRRILSKYPIRKIIRW